MFRCSYLKREWEKACKRACFGARGTGASGADKLQAGRWNAETLRLSNDHHEVMQISSNASSSSRSGFSIDCPCPLMADMHLLSSGIQCSVLAYCHTQKPFSSFIGNDPQ